MIGRALWTGLAAFALTVGAAAQTAAPGASPAPRAMTIDDAAFLAGRWVGEGMGGKVEENWAPPADGQMVGYFAYRNGANSFYELELLTVEDGVLVMKVKHFSRDFVGWEEKDKYIRFRGLRAAPNRIDFDGLRLVRSGQRLDIWVRMRGKDGRPYEEHFRLRRARG